MAFDEKHDVPLASSITRHVVLDEPATRDEIQAVLWSEFRLASEVNFEYRAQPTNVIVFVYSSEDRARAGEGLWLARLLWNSETEPEPELRIDDERLALAWARPVERFGLSEKERRMLFLEVVLEEDRARRDARDQYPLVNEVRTRYLGQLAQRRGLPLDTLRAIVGEGIEKAWPSRR